MKTFFCISQWGSQSSQLRKLCFSACKTVLCVLRCYKVTIFNLERDTCASCARLVLQSCDFPAGAGKTVLRALDSIVQLELKTCTLRTRVVLQSCIFRAGAQNLYFAYYTCTSKLPSSSQSWKLLLHVLYLYYKVVIFQLVLETCTSRTRFALQSCDRAQHLCYKVAIFEHTRLVLQSCKFPSRAGSRYFACQTCTTKVAILQLELEACTSRTRLVLQSCDFPARAANFYFA